MNKVQLMSTITAMNTGITGIQKGIRDAQTHASKIASSETFTTEDPASLTESFVGLKEAELQVKASAEVVKTTDEMLGTLLDDYA